MNEVQSGQTEVESPSDAGTMADGSGSVVALVIGDAGEFRDPDAIGQAHIQPPANDPMAAVDAGEMDPPSETGDGSDEIRRAEWVDPQAPTVRQRLIAQFERWLDRMDEGEAPPEGIPQEIIDDAGQAPDQDDATATDFYTLFSALTTLSGEVRLQGRTFKSLTDALAPIAQLPAKLDRIESLQGIVVQDVSRRAAAESQAAGPKSKDVLAVMFDLYDRLDRGLQTFEAGVNALRNQTPDGWRQRLLGGAAQSKALLDSADAIEEGYRLTLSRLDAAFLQWGVERIAAEGEMFDPNTMAVIEVQPAPGVADGTVLEVYKSGYLLGGQPLTTAQVKVCRNA